MRIEIGSVNERTAAALEARGALADYRAAFAAFLATGSRLGSPEDYATWSLGGYLRSAEAVATDHREGAVWA